MGSPGKGGWQNSRLWKSARAIEGRRGDYSERMAFPPREVYISKEIWLLFTVLES
jgi:hypothetical protein